MTGSFFNGDLLTTLHKQSIQYLYLCLQEALRRHPDRGIWTPFTSCEPYIQSERFSASEVLDNHKSVLTSFGIQTSNEELDLPYIYWIPKMHKILINIDILRVYRRVRPNLHPFYSQNCSHILTMSPDVLRDSLLKEWVQSDVDPQQLDHLKSSNFNLITNITSFDFSTLYTIIPHQKLKSRLATIIRNSFIHKNGNRRYKYSVLGCEGPYFVKEHSDSKSKDAGVSS